MAEYGTLMLVIWLHLGNLLPLHVDCSSYQQGPGTGGGHAVSLHSETRSQFADVASHHLLLPLFSGGSQGHKKLMFLRGGSAEVR